MTTITGGVVQSSALESSAIQAIVGVHTNNELGKVVKYKVAEASATKDMGVVVILSNAKAGKKIRVFAKAWEFLGFFLRRINIYIFIAILYVP
jgi:hypothetical protein